MTIFLSYSTKQQIYGIIDRDFKNDGEISIALNDPNNRLYILTRYCIENYLLEPKSVYNVRKSYLGRRNLTINNVNEIEIALYNICQNLVTLMAVNWLLKTNGKDRLQYNHPISDRSLFINKITENLKCSIEHAENIIEQAEEIIKFELTSLDKAHQRINGKYLMYHVYLLVTETKKGMPIDHFRRLLRDEVKRSLGIHSDIRKIVEERILGLTAN